MQQRKQHPDYYIIMGGIVVLLGISLLGAFFPIVDLIASILVISIAIFGFCVLMGKWLKNRRLWHEALYGDLSTQDPEVEGRKNEPV